MLSANIDGNGVEEILVMVMSRKTAEAFELEDVFKGGAFELGVGEGGEVDEGVFGGVGGAFALGGGGAGREFGRDDLGPARFVVVGNGLDHDFHEVGAGLHADDIKDTAFRFSKKGFDFGFGVWVGVLSMRTNVAYGERVTNLLHHEASG